MDESVAVAEVVKTQVSQVILGTRVRMDTIRVESWLAIYEELFKRHKDELLAISGKRLVEHINLHCSGHCEIHYEPGFGPNTKLIAWCYGPSGLTDNFPDLGETSPARGKIDIILLASGGNLTLSVVQYEFVLGEKDQVVSRYAQQLFPNQEQWQELLCDRSHGIGVLHAIDRAIKEDLSETHKRIKKLNQLSHKVNSYSDRISVG